MLCRQRRSSTWGAGDYLLTTPAPQKFPRTQHTLALAPLATVYILILDMYQVTLYCTSIPGTNELHVRW
jgi:hypothetical protein